MYSYVLEPAPVFLPQRPPPLCCLCNTTVWSYIKHTYTHLFTRCISLSSRDVCSTSTPICMAFCLHSLSLSFWCGMTDLKKCQFIFSCLFDITAAILQADSLLSETFKKLHKGNKAATRSISRCGRKTESTCKQTCCWIFWCSKRTCVTLTVRVTIKQESLATLHNPRNGRVFGMSCTLLLSLLAICFC